MSLAARCIEFGYIYDDVYFLASLLLLFLLLKKEDILCSVSDPQIVFAFVMHNLFIHFLLNVSWYCSSASVHSATATARACNLSLADVITCGLGLM